MDNRVQFLLTRDQIQTLRNGLRVILTPTIACRYLYSAAQYYVFRSLVKAVNRRASKPISRRFYFDLHLPWPQVDLLIQILKAMITPPAPLPSPAPDTESTDSLWEHLTAGEELLRIKAADKSFDEREFLATLKEILKPHN